MTGEEERDSSRAGYDPVLQNGTAIHPFTQEAFNQLYQYKKPASKHRLQECIKCSPIDTLFHLFPILVWLPDYQWRSDFSHDLISGVTVAIMHIPQGMAYALLGGVAPVVGIYMAFFPVLLYVLMGTSRHISMGTFAVVCMMTSNSVILYSDPIFSGNSTDPIVSLGNSTVPGYTPIQVASAICFIVGIWQVVLGICQLGIVSVLLSETLVSGFTTGAAIHVATSQVKNLLGVQVGRHTGPLKIVYTFIDIFENITNANLLSVGISAGTMLILIFYNELIKPRVGHKLPIPFPIEMLAVVTGSLVSYFTNLEADYGVTVVGDIPTGLPFPAPPPFELLPRLVVDGLVIAIVAFSVNMSMASIFSRKLNYSIDANQELVASGCSNMFGSFFSCMPFAASLSRSVIQQTTGGKTQLASVVSCILLLFVLLLIGPFFEPLPNCILASIVVVALKSLFVQVTQLPGLWRGSRMDGLVWLVTFLSVIILDIDYGLGCGIAVSLLSLVILGQRPAISRLGNVPDTTTYLDVIRYKAATETPGICILQVAGGLHFANCQKTQQKLYSLMNKQPDISSRPTATSLLERPTDKIPRDDQQIEAESEDSNHETISLVQPPIVCLILDMASVTFIDPSSIKTLLYIHNDLTSRGFQFYLAACSATVYEKLKHCSFFQNFPDGNVFASLHDAVTFAQQKI